MSPHAALPALLVVWTTPLAPPAHGGAGQEGARSAIVDLVERARGESPPGAGEVADALLAAGESGPALWLRAIDQRRPERVLVFPEEAPDVLDEPALRVLDRVTLEVPAELLRRRNGETPPEEHHLAAAVGLELLAPLATAGELGLAYDLALPHADADRDYRTVGRALEEVVREVLSRDPAGYPAVEALYAGEGPAAPRAYLLRGVGDARTFEALELLARLLGRVDDMDAVVLTQIGNVAQTVRTPLADTTLFRVRTYLASPSADERQQAAYALGRLDDYDAVSELIDLLRDEERGVRQNAYWALREITAMTINAEPRRWRMWFDTETEWWSREAPALLDTIYGASQLPAVVAAINTCGSKRLFRRQLSAELVPLLERPEPMVVRMTCSALFSLRATSAVPALVEALEHPDPEVRRQVRDTLRSLTGVDHGDSPAASQPGPNDLPTGR